MGSTLCRPLIQGRTVPVCSICEKVGNKPWRSLPPSEKRLWLIHDGQFFCTKCLISHRIERLQEDKAKEYSQSLTAAVTERYSKAPRGWTPLKKVSSGKQWHNTSSFKAPYVPSPSVEEAMSRVEKKPPTFAARQVDEIELCASVNGPVTENYEEACEKLEKYVVGASGKVLAAEQAAERGELRAGIMPSVEEIESSLVIASEAGVDGADEVPDFEALASAIASCRATAKSLGEMTAEELEMTAGELVLEGVMDVESVELSDGSRTSSLMDDTGALELGIHVD